jgi:adenine specific DNA methylase Mod
MGGSSNYYFGQTSAMVYGSKANRLANEDLKWEESEQTDIGIDLGLWNNKLTFSVDYYIKKTNGMIIDMPIPSYVDKKDRAQFLALMRDVLVLCRRLLREDGMIFVHVDYRADAHVRLLMDEIFGERCFINEIVWTYKSGGSSKSHFARKHDSILVYGKSKKYYIDIPKEKSYNRDFKP